jgi:hypothetical protein
VKLIFKDDLLLARDMYGQTDWNIAASGGHKDILEKLRGWAGVVQPNTKDDILLTKDRN